MDISKLKSLIAEDDLDEAFKELRILTEGTKYENDLIIQEGKYNRLKDKILKGTLNYHDAELTENNICSSLLSLIDKIKSTSSPASPIYDLSDKTKRILIASSIDPGGLVRTMSSSEGWQMQTNSDIIFSGHNAEEKAQWKKALTELCDKKLLQQLINKQRPDPRYEITSKGFEVVDKLRRSQLIDHFLDGLSDSMASLPEILDGSEIVNQDYKDLYKVVEDDLIQFGLVDVMIQSGTNKTIDGWGKFRISAKGRELILNGKSSLSLYVETKS